MKKLDNTEIFVLEIKVNLKIFLNKIFRPRSFLKIKISSVPRTKWIYFHKRKWGKKENYGYEERNLQTTLSLCVASRKSPLTTGCSARHTINFPSSSTVGEKLSSDFVVLFKISSFKRIFPCMVRSMGERR